MEQAGEKERKEEDHEVEGRPSSNPDCTRLEYMPAQTRDVGKARRSENQEYDRISCLRTYADACDHGDWPQGPQLARQIPKRSLAQTHPRCSRRHTIHVLSNDNDGLSGPRRREAHAIRSARSNARSIHATAPALRDLQQLKPQHQQGIAEGRATPFA